MSTAYQNGYRDGRQDYLECFPRWADEWKYADKESQSAYEEGYLNGYDEEEASDITIQVPEW